VEEREVSGLPGHSMAKATVTGSGVASISNKKKYISRPGLFPFVQFLARLQAGKLTTERTEPTEITKCNKVLFLCVLRVLCGEK
jgi:hypothetical protein